MTFSLPPEFGVKIVGAPGEGAHYPQRSADLCSGEQEKRPPEVCLPLLLLLHRVMRHGARSEMGKKIETGLQGIGCAENGLVSRSVRVSEKISAVDLVSAAYTITIFKIVMKKNCKYTF